MNYATNPKTLSSLFVLSALLIACSGNVPALPTLAVVPTLAPTSVAPINSQTIVPPPPVSTRNTQPATATNAKPDLAATTVADVAAATTRTPPAALTAIQSTATAQSKNATPTKPSAITGYLWWVTDRKQRILVYGPSHQTIPRDVETAEGWEGRGEACFVEAGARYVLEKSITSPSDGVGVQITSGRCNGFKGWVFAVTAHAEAP